MGATTNAVPVGALSTVAGAVAPASTAVKAALATRQPTVAEMIVFIRLTPDKE
jgi:hypothetical protein